MAGQEISPLLTEHWGRLLNLVLNRPRVLNTLNLELVRRLRRALKEAREDDGIRLILLSGAGERGFCAGGDLKELARAVRRGAVCLSEGFFREEYSLDLMIHQFPKAVAALADGITMGGGLGLAAGADLVVATEQSRMAMPETRIGFFPDVGATGWLFRKCPPGYPEYLALTGYEVVGPECVRLGLATHLVPADRLAALREAMAKISEELPAVKAEAVVQLKALLDTYADRNLPARAELDDWVKEHFAGKQRLGEIMALLRQCSLEQQECGEVFKRLAERSPTAMALTLKLLRANEGRPLPEVFEREAKAAHWIIHHPDYLEGIRARLIDKDNQPRWQQGLAEVETLQVAF